MNTEHCTISLTSLFFRCIRLLCACRCHQYSCQEQATPTPRALAFGTRNIEPVPGRIELGRFKPGFQDLRDIKMMFHLGKTERIILHAGIAMGFVKSIDLSQHQMTVADKNNTYRVKANINEFSIPTLEKFTVIPVFGLSYNLSKKNALQAVASPGLNKFREMEAEQGTKTVTQ